MTVPVLSTSKYTWNSVFGSKSRRNPGRRAVEYLTPAFGITESNKSASSSSWSKRNAVAGLFSCHQLLARST
jgi:hypothetical protein